MAPRCWEGGGVILGEWGIIDAARRIKGVGEEWQGRGSLKSGSQFY